MIQGGGIDNFSAEEALLIIGELYVEQRRNVTRIEALVEAMQSQSDRIAEFENQQPEPKEETS